MASVVVDTARAGVVRARYGGIGTCPYLTERMLASVPPLASLATLAGAAPQARRWLGLPAWPVRSGALPRCTILAVTDTYRAKAEARPHRPAAPSDEIAGHLRREVQAGRFDGGAVDAVLRAAGHRVRRRRDWPAGLTPHEVEVLRLVARGLSHQQIAQELVISRKTASNHVERIYAKIGVSNRTMASVFAITHGLMTDVEPTAADPR